MNTINKTFVWLVLAALLVTVVLYPTANLLYNEHSFYQGEVGFIYCTDPWACRHEVGHYMDQELGYPSKSYEFGMAVAIYMYYQYKYWDMNDVTKTIVSTSGIFVYSETFKSFNVASSPQQELYANLYAVVDGDISKLPSSLAVFYTNDKKYLTLYEDAMVNTYYFTWSKTMEQFLSNLWTKVVENKDILIKAGSAIAGALVGVGLITVLTANEPDVLEEEIYYETEEELAQ